MNIKNQELRKKSCCFTGHRPEKLHSSEPAVRKMLEEEIEGAIASGFTRFITGMAKGVDIWAAEIVLSRKKENPALSLVCALPFPSPEKSWSLSWKKAYEKIIQNADEVETLSNSYSTWAYIRRDRWMVDNSSRVIAVYEGEPGGTEETIAYAIENEIPVFYCENR